MSQVSLECENLGDSERLIDNTKVSLCLSFLQGRNSNIRNGWYALFLVPCGIYTRTFTPMSIPR